MGRLKNCIKKRIKQNDFLGSLLNLYHYRKDKSLIKQMSDLSCVSIITPKTHNIGMTPVCVCDVDSICGLFWYLRLVLEMLYYCDNMGFVPYIKWSKSLYFDKDYLETNNPFEYYFVQPFFQSEKDIEARPRVCFAPGTTSLARKLINDDNSIYLGNDDYINSLADIANRCLRYNKKTERAIQEFIDSIGVNGTVLGIHARGTDFRKKFVGHPVFVKPEEYFEFVDYAISKYHFEKIFIATDDQIILDAFSEHYKQIEVLYSTSVQRGSTDVGIHDTTYANNSSKYREGFDALCDVEALANCGGIISSVSNVPMLSRIYKKSRGEVFAYDKVIFKGLNKTGINPAYRKGI